METVNNMAAAAAKAVWGDNNKPHGDEPISGAQGDTSKGEPFDKGNIEEPTADTSTDTNSAEFSKTTGTAAESDNVPNNASTDLKSKDTSADTTKGQNDTRNPENPITNPKNAPTDVDDTGDGPQKAQNLDVPGPRAIEEVAQEQDGDAGNTGAGSAPGGDKSSTAKADDVDNPNGPHAPSTGEGTGEQYVKSTGLQADGGDFDATNPGAGKEADRLLEEKGVKKDSPEGDAETSVQTGGSDDKEKKGLSAKLKEKLHIR